MMMTSLHQDNGAAVIEQLVKEPLVNISPAFVNENTKLPAHEMTSRRKRAKRAREQTFEDISARNEALYDAEMSKRLHTPKLEPSAEVPAEIPDLPPELETGVPAMALLPEEEWADEEKPDDYSFVRDFYSVDLESLKRENEPLIPVDCWACRVVDDNSLYAVFENIWDDFLRVVNKTLKTGASIAFVGEQLYKLFHTDIVVKVREISDGQCEITGNEEGVEIWSPYCMMHHFLDHAATLETLKVISGKRYKALLNTQLRSGVLKRHKTTGRYVVDAKGLEVADKLMESVKKNAAWDTGTSSSSSSNGGGNYGGISSRRVLYNNNTIRRMAGGKNKAW